MAYSKNLPTTRINTSVARTHISNQLEFYLDTSYEAPGTVSKLAANIAFLVHNARIAIDDLNNLYIIVTKYEEGVHKGYTVALVYNGAPGRIEIIMSHMTNGTTLSGVFKSLEEWVDSMMSTVLDYSRWAEPSDDDMMAGINRLFK